MVFALIVFLLIVVFLAFFIGFNLDNVCTIWLFKLFENVPVSVLVFLSFAAGIVCSLIFILIGKFRNTFKSEVTGSDEAVEAKAEQIKRKKEKAEEKKQKLEKKREKQSEIKSEKESQNAEKTNVPVSSDSERDLNSKVKSDE